MFLAFRVCARLIFSKKGKGIFLWGSVLQVFGQCGGASMRTRQNGKTIFWGKGISVLPRLISRPQKGVWGMNAGGFRFRIFRRWA
ncbi:MAG: hypothetical protein A2831_03575 [Candidatus Yanofskybacteria bacterium RIFCSPHIGHO2_01_FULL_44_17]|uniref:Uncharacterized protein n=1 Tax=Candidatus Yanofskybacteria bacterium RIFCSPHIGHO2_01_FULL_44_17 TaxID=1802668 RepID=A0A1F8EXJ3_9BACT|nr:MAG: hypothetical protein A2831_03575 [Candidatus Yanofskybacteria bacterium RIFCSPHIGHO2_01_FULL_44_17]